MQISSRSFATAAAALVFSCASTAALAQNISTGYLTGAWQDNPQCQGSEAMVFYPNGTMSSAGSAVVNYTVSGPAQIVMHGAGGAAAFGLQYLDQNRLFLTYQNTSAVLYRCGGNTAAQPVMVPQLSAGYIAGGWGFNGNCASPEVFRAGGHVRTSQGQNGTWALLGNTLRLTINGVTSDLLVQVYSNSNMSATPMVPGSQPSNYTRCF